MIKIVTASDTREKELQAAAYHMIDCIEKELERGFFHVALSHVWKFLHQVNAYFHAQEPWKLAQSDKDAFVRVLSATCHSLQTVAVLLWPVMPDKMEELMLLLGQSIDLKIDNLAKVKAPWETSFSIIKGNALFEKFEIEPVKPAVDKADQKTAENKNHITIDDFAKIELRVGTIISCESVEDSEKLLRLSVDLGEENHRTVFTGLKKWHGPDYFTGKQGIFVANLKPRKMMGEVSEGMLLTVEDEEGIPRIVVPSAVIPNGTRLS